MHPSAHAAILCESQEAGLVVDPQTPDAVHLGRRERVEDETGSNKRRRTADVTSVADGVTLNSETASAPSDAEAVGALADFMIDCIRVEAERLHEPMDLIMHKHCMIGGRWLADGSRKSNRFVVCMHEDDYADFRAQIGEMQFFGGELGVQQYAAKFNNDGTQAH